ncbi:MAG: hypothetical protein KF896_14425 [Ignavibacteriae bacterium]|nr:hypothetical protein [Ignavibacteriota bacterium]
MIRLILILLLLVNVAASQPQKWVIEIDRCGFDKISDTRMKLLEGEVGTMEIGNNRGARVDEYNDSALGFKKGRGAPYCQSVATWSWLKAGHLPYPRTALANAPFDYAVRNGKRVSYVPERGDEMTWRYPNSWKGHKETVAKVLENGFVITVAGNVTGSSLSNDPVGGGVKLMRRGIYQKIGKMQMRGLVGFRRKK